ncbi:MAG: hypothetical protein ACQEWV_31485, partial [Bacillota bacterium]
VLQSITKNDERPLLMAIVIKDTDIALTLLQTHPRQIILSKAVSLTSKDIHDIGDKLNNTFQEIPGLQGQLYLSVFNFGYIYFCFFYFRDSSIAPVNFIFAVILITLNHF